jgi:protein-tyrosine phosphatase
MNRLYVTPRVKSADNFRDIAGDGSGYVTAAGRMRRGVFYRSNHLVLTPDDAQVITGLGVTSIYDLREADELERWPDVEIQGARWVHYPTRGIEFSEQEIAGNDAAVIHSSMVAGYRRFVTEPENRKSLGRLLRAMAVGDGPEVFHCASGKDRTGWVAALLQHIAGVEWEIIIGDYLLSNERSASSRAQMLKYVSELYGPEKLAILEPGFVVHEDYLNGGVEAAREWYGGIDGYIAHGLAVPSKLREALMRRLTA